MEFAITGTVPIVLVTHVFNVAGTCVLLFQAFLAHSLLCCDLDAVCT